MRRVCHTLTPQGAALAKALGLGGDRPGWGNSSSPRGRPHMAFGVSKVVGREGRALGTDANLWVSKRSPSRVSPPTQAVLEDRALLM